MRESIKVAQPNRLSWFFRSVSRATRVLLLFTCFGNLPCPQTLAQEIEVSAELELKTGTRDGVLTVTAAIPDDWHTFSLTQPVGGPTRSTLKLKGTGIQLIGDFVAQQEPEIHDDEFAGTVEELRGTVFWAARVQVSPDVEVAKLQAKIEMYAQICTDQTQICKVPTTYSGEIEFLGESADLELPKTAKQIKLDKYQPNNSHVLLSGSVFTADGAKNFKPGDTVTMEITAVPLESYHVYAYQTKSMMDHTPTMISTKRPAGWTIAGPKVSVEPTIEHDLPIHDVNTSWRFKIKIPKTVAADQAVTIIGGIQLQTCNEVGCDPPSDSRFTVTVPMGTDSAAALKFEEAPYGSVAKAVEIGDFAVPIYDSYAVRRKPKPAKKPDNEFIEADTPRQIAAMARLYDVSEPIKCIGFSNMDQHPVISPSLFSKLINLLSKASRQNPLLIFLLFACVGGAIVSWMLYMFSGRGIETKETPERNGARPRHPRLRRFALAAGLIFPIGILATGLSLMGGTGPWTMNDQTQPVDTITWANWHPGKVAQQLKQNKIVWVTYSADWDPTSQVNLTRIAANDKLVKRLNKMEVSFVKVDFTTKGNSQWKELARTGEKTLPVNLIYPPNYPDEPAIKLEFLFGPADVDLVLDRMEAITSNP